MHLFHIPQSSIQDRNVHISVLNGGLWDMEQMNFGIVKLSYFDDKYFTQHHTVQHHYHLCMGTSWKLAMGHGLSDLYLGCLAVSGQGMEVDMVAQIAKIMGPTWGPPGSCRPQMGPILAHEPCYRGWKALVNHALWSLAMTVNHMIRFRAVCGTWVTL